MSVTELVLAPREHSPAAARETVRAAVHGAGLDHLLDEALLLTTELVTNALVHGGTEVELRIESEAQVLRVEVSDRGRGRVSVPQAVGPEQESGRGMFLVDMLSAAWGTRHHATGKTVWFELGGSPAPAAPGPVSSVVGPAPRDLAFLLGLNVDVERQLAPEQLVAELLRRLVEGLSLGSAWVVARRPGEASWSLYCSYDERPAPDPEAVCRGMAPMWPSVTFQGADGAVLGALVLGRNTVDADELMLVRLLAERVGVLLRDEHARTAARRTRGTLALLAEAGELFAGTLDVQLTAALATRLVVPRLAEAALVWTVFGHVPSLQAIGHREEAAVEALRAAALEMDGLDWIYAQIAQGPSGRPVLQPAKAMAAVLGASCETRHGECAVLPLIARGRLIGVWLVANAPGSGFLPEEMGLLVDLARTAALAMDNARLYEERSAVASALQASLLPPELPVVANCEFGARYLPTGGGNEVGGDFYDVFPLPDGGWGVAIGDVCGKGPSAAAITGVAREILRLLLRDGHSAPVALRRLNEALLTLEDRGRLCTVALGTVRVGEGGIAVRFSSAGHPPPAHVDPRGAVEFIGTNGTLLGAIRDIDVGEDEIVLAPGESLVFYTDGVTERRGTQGMFGEDNLLAVLGAAGHRPAGEIAAAVETAVTRFGVDEGLRDDLAVLVIRATELVH
ncbi:MAG TPA: SpoIIE family protein phosphatase [Sporichthyaceae bacterium]|nr:SpoIIE family protein phosphatase [Sporichthyaceae bacterium]